ncbi:MAG: PQQ-binding-like beta-propeller repeat protein [Acidobacteriota bacterium]
MNAPVGLLLLGLALTPAVGRGNSTDVPTATDLAGAWSGSITHDGETTAFALEIIPEADGKLLLKATIPSMHLAGQPFGSVPLKVDGDRVILGSFDFRYDEAARSLSGVVPEGLAPFYKIPLVLYRVERIEVPVRPAPAGALVRPAWTYEAASPLWAGPSCAGGVVYVGGQDGRIHAVDARKGGQLWTFRAGGAIRARPTVVDAAVYVQADDGFLYKLKAAGGEEVWRVKVVEKPIKRLAFDDPKSRYDRFGSDVVVRDGRLYLGTHDGNVLAIDPSTGARLWSFATADSVLATPAVDSGRVYAGSFDMHVCALDAATGRLLWNRATNGAVVSTPAVAGDRVVVGNRAYDFLALDAKTGAVVWTRYVWFSWIESSASIRDGVAYVGSSDAASVFAFDVASGRRVWSADVFGWAWGQPAVTDTRVYAGTSSQVGYPAGHRAGVIALDRATGRTVWHYEAAAPGSGAFGFPGSPAIGEGFLFVSSLDGRLYAFAL